MILTLCGYVVVLGLTVVLPAEKKKVRISKQTIFHTKITTHCPFVVVGNGATAGLLWTDYIVVVSGLIQFRSDIQSK